MHNSKNNFEKTAIKVSLSNTAINLLLSIIKFIIGLICNSGAMISDAINSISDVLSSIIVIIGVKFSSKKSDKSHPYGHERFECVAALILAILLLVTGIFVGHVAIELLLSNEYKSIEIPSIFAIYVAVICIITKEFMYWYTRHYAKLLDSVSLMGVALDNRSDVFSTSCVLIGILGANLGAPILDIIARLIICLLIIKSSINIFNEAIRKMVDSSCSEKTEAEIINCAKSQEGVVKVDKIKTRIFGNKIYVDIIISAAPQITLSESYKISSSVHDAIENTFTNVKHITVQVKPMDID